MTSKQTTKVDPKRSYKDYLDLIETVVKVEFKKIPSHYMVEFSELRNVGIFTVHTILTQKPNDEFNITYLSTAIKWAIRNELRRRFKWYSLKTNKKEEISGEEKEQIREVIYETILSIDELAENDNPTQIKDHSYTPEEDIELSELNSGIREAIKKLPQKQRDIIEARFYKNKKLRELSEEFNISSSRISRIIQSALNTIKQELQEQHLV